MLAFCVQFNVCPQRHGLPTWFESDSGILRRTSADWRHEYLPAIARALRKILYPSTFGVIIRFQAELTVMRIPQAGGQGGPVASCQETADACRMVLVDS